MAAPTALPRLERAVDERSHGRFLEVTGRRMALLGNELGVFEAWMWPLQLVRELEVRVRTDQLRRGRDLARRVAFQPDRTEIELQGPDFRVRQTMFAALDRRALVVLLEVESERDLVLEIGFVPAFEPMWPAGLGGRIALRDADTGAFALTEELGRFAALIGSPEAEPMEVSADHALPRECVSLRIPVSTARARRGPIACFVAGAEVAPKPLSEAARVGEEDAASGHARSHEVLGLAREQYRWIAASWREVQRELAEHWRDFLGRTTHFESDDARHTEAFLWAKIAIEKAWVEVDGLGRGLVAGLAPAGTSGRPGFGWFFDGDALVASRAMVGYGDRKGARRVLDFVASHQRADGKMMHELVLSAGLCNWFEDYPYAYYKAQLTPGFISCLGHYFELSGDVELRQQLWPNVLAAYRCCVASLDGDGLLSNKKLGLAAVEAGSLVGKIRADIYLQGIWITALREMESMALALGDKQVAQDARRRLELAESALKSFWSEERRRYGFAHLADGSLCTDSTAYQALPLSRGIGDRKRALASAAALNRPDLASDWGVRFFASDASVYDAANYNTGSVFPYANNFAILAQFQYGLTTSGHQLLASQVALHGFSGLGFVPEHLFGDRYAAPARGVPHQIFSSACIVQSTLFGMLHVVPPLLDEYIGDPYCLVVALPPECDRIRVSRLRILDSEVHFELVRRRANGRTHLSATFMFAGGTVRLMAFTARVPPLSRNALLAPSEGAPVADLTPSHAMCDLGIYTGPILVSGIESRAVSFESGPELIVDSSPLVEGAASSRLRVCETEFDDQRVTWTVWGLGGRTYRVGVRSDRAVEFEGARRVSESELEITFPGGKANEFVSSRVSAIARD
jgi:hypothetical protein